MKPEAMCGKEALDALEEQALIDAFVILNKHKFAERRIAPITQAMQDKLLQPITVVATASQPKTEVLVFENGEHGKTIELKKLPKQKAQWKREHHGRKGMR